MSFTVILINIYFWYRAHIFGLHVADYMRNLEQEDDDSFKRQFGKYIKFGVNADAVSWYTDLFHT